MHQRNQRLVFPIFLVAVCITLASGVIHGNISGRWGPTEYLESAATQLTKLPAEIGDWQLDADKELGETAIKMLRCAGYCNQTYVHRTTGDRVAVAVMLGPSGPMSVHAPEVCYASSFELSKPRSSVQAKTDDHTQHELWDITFQSKDAKRTQLNVLYGWSTGGPWMAPRRPRFQFAGKSILYKIQISHQLPPGSSGPNAVCLEFFTAVLPHLQTRLLTEES